MSYERSSCDHSRTIITLHESEEVCLECGLVVSIEYEKYSGEITEIPEKNNIWNEELSNILDRIHVSKNYASNIMKDFNGPDKPKNRNWLLFCIYKILNELGFNISLQELANISGQDKSMIFKEQTENVYVELNYNEFIDKYCHLLGLPFKISSLIKDKIIHTTNTGHSPTSIIASYIYLVCKEKKIKVSIKRVSEITNTSCISIQRYLKYIKKNASS